MTVAQTALKALSIAMTVKKLLNVEYKFHDVKQTAVSVTSTPVIVQLTNVGQGDTAQIRDGASIKWTKISLRHTIILSAAARSSQVRLLLVLDRQTNGAIYSASDVLDDVSINDIIVSMYNLDNKYRFRVLKDVTMTLDENGNESRLINWTVPMSTKCRFSGTAGTIADLSSYSLSLLQVSSEAANFPSITTVSRLRYIDN